MADDKLWDTPTNVVSKLDAVGELAKKHGISPDRAQMLIDRFGNDAERLDAAAKGAKAHLRSTQRASLCGARTSPAGLVGGLARAPRRFRAQGFLQRFTALTRRTIFGNK